MVRLIVAQGIALGNETQKTKAPTGRYNSVIAVTILSPRWGLTIIVLRTQGDALGCDRPHLWCLSRTFDAEDDGGKSKFPRFFVRFVENREYKSDEHRTRA